MASPKRSVVPLWVVVGLVGSIAWIAVGAVLGGFVGGVLVGIGIFTLLYGVLILVIRAVQARKQQGSNL